MNEAAIRKRISELKEVMTGLPSGNAKAAPDGLCGSHTSIEAQPMEVLLDQLRLQVKYLVFDLEATRRENRYLRQMIENRRRGPSDDPRGGQGDF